MLGSFERDGVQFQFPDNWTLGEEDAEGGWTVTAEGPTTAFLIVSYSPDVDDPADMADAALVGLQEAYPKLDAEGAVDSLAGQPAIGFDVNFIHLDMTNTCWIRSIPAGTGCLLVLAQCCDDELAFAGETLKSILASFLIAD